MCTTKKKHTNQNLCFDGFRFRWVSYRRYFVNWRNIWNWVVDHSSIWFILRFIRFKGKYLDSGRLKEMGGRLVYIKVNTDLLERYSNIGGRVLYASVCEFLLVSRDFELQLYIIWTFVKTFFDVGRFLFS